MPSMAAMLDAGAAAPAPTTDDAAVAAAAGVKRRIEEVETAPPSPAASSESDESVRRPPAEGPKPPKAYKSAEFLSSHDARLIRIMCELQEPGRRLDAEGVENIVMFFGSARAKPRAEYEEAVRAAEAKVAQAPGDAVAEAALVRLRKQAFLVESYETTRELAGLVAEWAEKRVAEQKPSYHVGTGAGPGMMEAANQGAYEAGGKSVGLGISLPFEDRLNRYVTPELGFEFHYFFTRKFWMSYKCMGLVVAPGGLGTCDELFELLTLMQTGKIKRKLPIILLGKKFWQACINWDAFVEYGMISEADARQLVFADTAQEAFEALTAGIERLEAEGSSGAPRSRSPKLHK